MEDGGNKMGRGAINDTEEEVGVGFITTVFNKPFWLKIKQQISRYIFFNSVYSQDIRSSPHPSLTLLSQRL